MNTVRRTLVYISVITIAAAAMSSLAAVLEVASFLGHAGAQARNVGFYWLFSRVLPDTVLDGFSPLATTVYPYNSFDSPGGWWSFLSAAVLSNICLGALTALILVPFLWRMPGKGSSEFSWGWPVAAAGIICTFPTALHLLVRWQTGGNGEAADLAAPALGLLAALILGRRLYRKHVTPYDSTVSSRANVYVVVLGLAAAAMGLILAALPSESRRPNILLVSIDTLRADHLSSYGYERETSPNIDALAGEGVRFSQAISPSSWTLPTHMTLLTGIPPVHHGVNDDDTSLNTSVVTLAEVLLSAGYRTAAFVSGAYLSPEYGFSQGFESYDDSTLANGADGVTSPTLEDLVKDWIVSWREEKADKPFFVFLHMFDVHYNYVPPDEYIDMFDPDYDGPIDGRNFWLKNGIYDKDMDPRDLRHVLALYDAEIRFTDHHLGRIFDHLRETGELDNTIVAVTSDHGEEFFEHGRKGHRKTLYDEVVRIPLILRYPSKIPPGVVVDRQVQLLDVPASLLSLAGVVPPPSFGMQRTDPQFQSFDLVPWIEKRPNLPFITAFGDLHGNVASLRTEMVKLTYGFNTKHTQYFDLVEDPGELENHARKRPDDVAVLRPQLKFFVTPSPQQRKAVRTQLDEEQLDRLRSLGYIK